MLNQDVFTSDADWYAVEEEGARSTDEGSIE